MLRYGIVLAALALSASPAAAKDNRPSVPAVAVPAPAHGQSRGGFEGWLRWGEFCHWHPKHRLCLQLATSPSICDRRPDHPLCMAAGEDRFCSQRPDHPLCGGDLFCSLRPDHPRCDDKPPSPS
jgi:hypothetical protein